MPITPDKSWQQLLAGLTWRFLPLTRGESAIVDADKFEELSKQSWHTFKTKGRTYASRYSHIKNGKQTMVFMHRQLLGLKKGDPLFGEHIDGNGLHNRDVNLRVATNSQNQANRPKPCVNRSGHKGVCWHKVKEVWIVNIRVNGKRIHLGYFPLEELQEAADTYIRAAQYHFGEFAHQRLA